MEHVVITHAHRDQVCGLYRCGAGAACIHVPSGDAALVQDPELRRFWATYQAGGCPSCYAAPRHPVPAARADLAADTETCLGGTRFCAISTPGHTSGALSYIVHWHGRELAFCGDAAHAGGTLHQPYHLEWDHWTPAGCLAAWYGLERLGYCHFDLLLPAHGPAVASRPRACIAGAQRRLMAMIRAKGSVCAGARQRRVEIGRAACRERG